MKFFDALVHSDARPNSDFANMAYFDVERVIACSNAPRPFSTAYDLRAYLDELSEEEPDRLAKLGICAHVAVGVHPNAVPARAHYEIWRDLPELLRRPSVVALGELTLKDGAEQEWTLIRRQISVLLEHRIGKPVIFRLPANRDTRTRVGWVRRFDEICRDCGLDPSEAVVYNVDWLTLDDVEGAGFHAGVEVGPFGLTVAAATRIVLHHDHRRLIAASGLRLGARDVLALPKLALALGEAEVAPGVIERVVYGNAMALFIR
jgi:hypothetical protein